VDRIPPDFLKRILRSDLRRAVLTMHVPNTGAASTRPAFHRMAKSLAAIANQHPGIAIHLTGSSVVAAENMSSVIGDLVRSLSFASITVFLVLTIALRSVTLGLLSIIPNAFPLLLNAGILYWLDKPLQITTVLTFSICLGIAVDDTIHFLIRFLRERKQGRSVRDAIVHSFERVGLALLITTAIITGGFAASMTSALPGLVFFGGLACTALLAALLGDLIILPALLDRIVGKQERRGKE
jgi:predicted RND superfamily exporter protein